MNYRNIDDLIKEIQSAKIIGIDGTDGSGKTYLSHEIGKKLGIPVLNLDDYLIKDKESYVEHLKYKEISEFIGKNKNSLIIEGVCLLDVLKKLHLDLDCLIYVKLIDEYDEWLREEECDIRDSAEETIKRLEDTIKILYPNNQGLDAFRKEIIYYHVNNRPVEKANYVFERIESSMIG